MKGKYPTMKNEARKGDSQNKASQRKQEAEHSSRNAFVKSAQMKTAGMGGKDPKTRAEDYKFNAEMTNTGERAQSLARKLTSGLDKQAFPVD